MSAQLRLVSSPEKLCGDHTRSERPCPNTECRYHLAELRDNRGTRGIDKPPRSGVRLSQEATCALDIADTGPHSLDVLGDLIGVGRERIRQIEDAALAKLGRKHVREITELSDGWTHAVGPTFDDWNDRTGREAWMKKRAKRRAGEVIENANCSGERAAVGNDVSRTPLLDLMLRPTSETGGASR